MVIILFNDVIKIDQVKFWLIWPNGSAGKLKEAWPNSDNVKQGD